MPEGPEVKRLVLWLNKKIKNKTLKNIEILNGKYLKKNIKNIDNLKFPLTIEKVDCKGKFIYILFKNSDTVIFITLGMTGWFYLKKTDNHDNVLFKIDTLNLYFNDFRNFGTLIISNKVELNKKIKTLGPDILDPNNNTNEFLQRIERKRNDSLISTALLDQKVASGVGNYLRAEGLYLAKLSPYREIKDITKNKLIELWEILKQLGYYYFDEDMGRKLGIIKINLPNLLNKKLGPSKYKPDENSFFVYRQDVDPYGNKVISEMIGDRTIHYVKSIQK